MQKPMSENQNLFYFFKKILLSCFNSNNVTWDKRKQQTHNINLRTLVFFLQRLRFARMESDDTNEAIPIITLTSLQVTVKTLLLSLSSDMNDGYKFFSSILELNNQLVAHPVCLGGI